MAMDNKGLEVGQHAPDWELTDITGAVISSRRLRGRPIMLFFFRGTWCPSCRKQMEQVSENWSRLKDKAHVFGLVAEDVGRVSEFTKRTPLPFALLPDPERKVIQAHNVYQRFGLNGFRIAYPSTILIDQEGIVRYCYVGSSQFDRPQLEEVIQELESLFT